MDTRHTVTLAGLLVLTAALYAPILRAPFVYEDIHGLTAPVSWAIPGRGVTQWTWQVVGPDPPRAHGLNVALHLGNAGLVAWVGLALAGPTAAVAAAGIWGLHPLLTEGVSYVTARGDLLVTLFTLIAVGLALRVGMVVSAWRLTGIGLALLGAALSKEIGLVALPLVLWTLMVSRPSSGVLRQALWGLIGLMVGATWGRVASWLAMDPTSGGAWWPWPEFVSLQLVALWHLLALIVWPVGLSIDHDPVTVSAGGHGLAWALTGTVLAVGIWAWRRAPLVAWALGWGVLAVGPRFVLPTNEVIREYTLLPALVGGCVLMGALVARALRCRPLVVA